MVGNFLILARLASAAICVALCSCAGTGVSRKEVVFTPPDWPVEIEGTVFKPRSAAPAPAVLLIHGGVKIGDDGRWVMNGTARKLAERGYYVLNITYRDIKSWEYPAQLDDVRTALAWMRANAPREGIDRERIAVFGYSAGGYLGALAALDDRPGVSGVKAIVAGSSPMDLSVYARGDLVRRYFGTAAEPFPEQFAEASPLVYVRRDSPPVFLYHGTGDELVRPDHTEKFARVLRHYRVPHEVFWIPGKGHVTAFFSSGEAVEKAIDFLDRRLKPAS